MFLNGKTWKTGRPGTTWEQSKSFPLTASQRSFDNGNRERPQWHQRMRTFDPEETFAIPTHRRQATGAEQTFGKPALKPVIGPTDRSRIADGRHPPRLLPYFANGYQPHLVRSRSVRFAEIGPGEADPWRRDHSTYS